MAISANVRRAEPTPRREHDGETYSAATRSRSTSTQPIGAASPAPRDLLPLAWPIFRPVPSTSLVQPAREWHDAVYLRAPPRQRPRHAESASSRHHVANDHAQQPGPHGELHIPESEHAAPVGC